MRPPRGSNSLQRCIPCAFRVSREPGAKEVGAATWVKVARQGITLLLRVEQAPSSPRCVLWKLVPLTEPARFDQRRARWTLFRRSGIPLRSSPGSRRYSWNRKNIQDFADSHPAQKWRKGLRAVSSLAPYIGSKTDSNPPRILASVRQARRNFPDLKKGGFPMGVSNSRSPLSILNLRGGICVAPLAPNAAVAGSTGPRTKI